MKNLIATALIATMTLSTSAQAFASFGGALDGIPNFSNEEYDAARVLDWNDPADREAILIILASIGVFHLGTVVLGAGSAAPVMVPCIPTSDPVTGVIGLTLCGGF